MEMVNRLKYLGTILSASGSIAATQEAFRTERVFFLAKKRYINLILIQISVQSFFQN